LAENALPSIIVAIHLLPTKCLAVKPLAPIPADQLESSHFTINLAPKYQ
jgi:hypothetical protein